MAKKNVRKQPANIVNEKSSPIQRPDVLTHPNSSPETVPAPNPETTNISDTTTGATKTGIDKKPSSVKNQKPQSTHSGDEPGTSSKKTKPASTKNSTQQTPSTFNQIGKVLSHEYDGLVTFLKTMGKQGVKTIGLFLVLGLLAGFILGLVNCPQCYYPTDWDLEVAPGSAHEGYIPSVRTFHIQNMSWDLEEERILVNIGTDGSTPVQLVSLSVKRQTGSDTWHIDTSDDALLAIAPGGCNTAVWSRGDTDATEGYLVSGVQYCIRVITGGGQMEYWVEYAS